MRGMRNKFVKVRCNIFHEFLEDISEDVLPNERTGFKQSVIWNKLYNFQRDAALAGKATPI